MKFYTGFSTVVTSTREGKQIMSPRSCLAINLSLQSQGLHCSEDKAQEGLTEA
jgi:hypothetical protein